MLLSAYYSSAAAPSDARICTTSQLESACRPLEASATERHDTAHIRNTCRTLENTLSGFIASFELSARFANRIARVPVNLQQLGDLIGGPSPEAAFCCYTEIADMT